MSETKQLEKLIEGLKVNYKTIFNTAEGKRVLADLEKRCHYHSTTNVKGDSHESAYMEGQRSVLLFIKSMSETKMKKENTHVSEQTTQETVPVEKTEASTEPVKTEPTTETKPEVTTTTTTTTSS